MATGAKLIADIKEKSFGEEALFDGLRFEVPAGQVVALIGPSGVGKSTLLRMIGGIDPDYEGDILIDDLVPADAEVPGFVAQAWRGRYCVWRFDLALALGGDV